MLYQKERAALPKKQKKEALANLMYPSISYEIAAQIEKATGQETRVTVPGHFQRGGSPVPYDKLIATRFGAAAGECIINEHYGCMVSLINGRVVPVALSDIAGKLKTVPADCEIIKTARLTGISFGD